MNLTPLQKFMQSHPGTKTQTPLQKYQESTGVPSEQPTPIPFGALGVAANGEPYYGTGFLGWSRKTFANLYNPDQILDNPGIGEQMKQDIGNLGNGINNIFRTVTGKQVVQNAQTGETTTPSESQFAADSALHYADLLNKVSWSKWGEVITGVSADTFSQTLGAIDVSMRNPKDLSNPAISPGEFTKVMTGVLYRSAGQLLWSGLGLLQTGGWTVKRAIIAPALSLSEYTDMDSPAVHQANADHWKNLPDWMQKILSMPNGNMVTLGIKVATGKFNPDEFVSILKRNEAAGDMISTMAYDKSVREEFALRYAQGQDPSMLKLELQNPIVELIGDVALDPMTYMGMEFKVPVLGVERAARLEEARAVANFMEAAVIDGEKVAGLKGLTMKFMGVTANAKLTLFGPWETVAKLPDLGEIVALGVGRNRIQNEMDLSLHIDESIQRSASNLFKGTDAAENAAKLETDATKIVSANTRLLKTVDNVVSTAEKAIDDVKYSVFTLRSSDRAIQLSRESGLMISQVFHTSDHAFDLLDAAIKMVKGTDEQRAWAIVYLLGDPIGKNFLSPLGIRAALNTAEVTGDVSYFMKGQEALRAVEAARFSNEIPDADLVKAAEKFIGRWGDTPQLRAEKMTAEYISHLNIAAERLNPSVGEMKDAFTKVDSALKGGSKIEELDQAAVKAYEAYKNVPNWVKNVNDINEVAQKPKNFAMGFFTKVWLGVFPTAQPVRNIWGNIMPIALDMGSGVAFDVLGKSFAGMASSKISSSLILSELEKVKFMTGGQFPEGMLRGIGIGNEQIMNLAKQKYSFLNWGLKKSQEMELIAAATVCRTSVERDIMQAFDSGGIIPSLESLKAVNIPDEASSLLISTARANLGNAEKTREAFMWKMSEDAIESFREIEPSSRMNEFMRSQNLMDDFQVVRDSKTQASFERNLKKFTTRYDDVMEKAAAKDAAQGLDIGYGPLPEQVLEPLVEVQKAAGDGKVAVTREEMQTFSRMLNSRRGAYNATYNATIKLTELMSPIAKDKGIPVDFAIEISPVAAKYQADMAPLDGFRDYMVGVIKGVEDGKFPTRNLPQMWLDTQYRNLTLPNGKPFTLAEYFKKVNSVSLTKDEFIDKAWRATMEVTGNSYNNALNNYITGMIGQVSEDGKTMGVFRAIAQKLGVDFDQLVLSMGGEGKVNWVAAAIQNQEFANYYNDVWMMARGVGTRNVQDTYDAIHMMSFKKFGTSHALGTEVNVSDKIIMHQINAHLPKELQYEESVKGLREFSQRQDALTTAAEAFTGRNPAFVEKAAEAVAPATEVGTEVSTGMTRLYRGEAAPGGVNTLPDWVKQARNEKGITDAQGRWFTDKLENAKWYQKEAGETGRISYVDVPTKDLEQYRVSNMKDVSRFSKDPTTEFFVSPEIANTRNVFTPVAEVSTVAQRGTKELGLNDGWRLQIATTNPGDVQTALREKGLRTYADTRISERLTKTGYVEKVIANKPVTIVTIHAGSQQEAERIAAMLQDETQFSKKLFRLINTRPEAEGDHLISKYISARFVVPPGDYVAGKNAIPWLREDAIMDTTNAKKTAFTAANLEQANKKAWEQLYKDYGDEFDASEWLGKRPTIKAAEPVAAAVAKTPEEIAAADAALLRSKYVYLPMPYIEGQRPTEAQFLYYSRDGFMQDANAWKKEVVSQWGQTRPNTKFNPDQMKAVNGWIDTMQGKLNELYPGIMMKANKTRDFILHDYMKNYGDLAASYLFMFPYWQTRSYLRFTERVVQDPKIAVAYMAYRRYMASIHAGMPEWYKYNIPISFLPGTSESNPLYFNLESSLNPVNGMTGVDFNDPLKRVDWLSSTVDDIGKLGPSVFAPLQWAVAGELYLKGENDAARRWMGRLFPQTQTIKSAIAVGSQVATNLGNKYFPGTNFTAAMDRLSKTGINIGPFVQNSEADPFINYFSGGLDPYEERRVGRQLANMAFNGKITYAEAEDVAQQKSGPIWQEAIQLALQERGPGQLAASLLGVGFKPRTKGDILVDQFYTDYYKLVSSKDYLKPEDYRSAWTVLSKKYPFMDVVLISKRAGFDRDTAYSYSVLGRIPPGQMTSALTSIGLSSAVIDKFYTTKGDFSTWDKIDYSNFMTAIATVGSVLDIPANSTRMEWDSARTSYAGMQTIVKTRYGEDIYDKIDLYYQQIDQTAKDIYMEKFPEVSEAMNYQNELIINQPILSKYYGGIDTVNRYWISVMYDMLRNELGGDVMLDWQVYYQKQQEDAVYGTKTAAEFKRDHPVMQQYTDRKKELQAWVNQQVMRVSAMLPPGPTFTLRPDMNTQAIGSQELLTAITPKPTMTWKQWQGILSEPMQRLILNSIQTGEPLEYVAQTQLDYMASQYGFQSGNEMFQAIGLSLQSSP
jgi:hypothetical protein